MDELTDSLIPYMGWVRVRDCNVKGILDDHIYMQQVIIILRELSLTLQSALDICRSSELAFAQLRSLTTDKQTVGVETIDQRKSNPNPKHTGCG